MLTFEEFKYTPGVMGNHPIILVKVNPPSGDKKFLYAFPMPGYSAFKKNPKKDKGELKMVHLDKKMDCWRIMLKDGELKCLKSMWPRTLDPHLVINDDKTPLHWHSMDYFDPFAFVKYWHETLLKEKNIEWR